jgi:hypothetical protein
MEDVPSRQLHTPWRMYHHVNYSVSEVSKFSLIENHSS